jgi:predicted RNA-binding Zn ribbon-like protein
MSRDISRVLEFPFSGGRLCLDFVGTLADRNNRPTERLRDHQDLGRWFAEAGLAEEVPATNPAALMRASRLREAIYRVVSPARAGQAMDPADIELINAAAQRTPLAPRYDPEAGRIRWSNGSYTAGLATVARDVIDLLAGDQLQRIRECAAPDCSLLFLDTSRPGARRWCSMARCGNRAKVSAAYRRRTRPEPSR